MTDEDRKKYESPGAAMSKSTGGTTARMMLLSVSDDQWDPTEITPTNVSGIKGSPGASALFMGGAHSLATPG